MKAQNIKIETSSFAAYVIMGVYQGHWCIFDKHGYLVHCSIYNNLAMHIRVEHFDDKSIANGLRVITNF